MFQKKIRIVLLWCAGALALLSLLALLYYTFLYKPDMLLGKANDLDREFSNMVKLPENAYIGNVETQYFEKANFKGAYTMYGGTYAPRRLLGEEMRAAWGKKIAFCFLMEVWLPCRTGFCAR